MKLNQNRSTPAMQGYEERKKNDSTNINSQLNIIKKIRYHVHSIPFLNNFERYIKYYKMTYIAATFQKTHL